MKTLLRYLLAILFLSATVADAEDEVSGRIYPDNYQPEAGEDVPWEFDQRATYFPRSYASTYDMRMWAVYIHSAEIDPPTSVTVYIYDDTPVLSQEKIADLQVLVGRWDGARNFIPYRSRIIRDIELTQGGLTRVPVNIHNYRAEIVITKLLRVQPKSNILLKDNY